MPDTQHIFYERQDVLYASIHADPSNEFPYFLGYADETGAGAGEGFNCNVPLQHGSGWQEWGAALDDVTRRIETFDADAVVVSLGVDTLAGDPLGTFRLTADNYRRAGARIARMGKPMLFIMEDGYATYRHRRR